MLRPRIIVSILISNGLAYKTVRFSNPQYVGDPLNLVKIYNEKGADEISVFDISATAAGREPNYSLIEKLASQCRTPFCYGGGVRTAEQARRIFSLGAEKIALNTAALENPEILNEISGSVGAQSVVVVLNIKEDTATGRHYCYLQRGEKRGKDLEEQLHIFNNYQFGELVLNSIDRDGTGAGFDLRAAKIAREIIHRPLTILGGAGSLEDFSLLFSNFGNVGAAAGSYFIYKGRLKAVLPSYPGQVSKNQLFKKLSYADTK